jgi:hypothetical protein
MTGSQRAAFQQSGQITSRLSGWAKSAAVPLGKRFGLMPKRRSSDYGVRFLDRVRAKKASTKAKRDRLKVRKFRPAKLN